MVIFHTVVQLEAGTFMPGNSKEGGKGWGEVSYSLLTYFMFNPTPYELHIIHTSKNSILKKYILQLNEHAHVCTWEY
jgi:hypothetical protein